MEMERGGAEEFQELLRQKVVALQEDRDRAIQQFEDEVQRRAKQNKFSDTLLRDLDEMGKALEHSRHATRQAKRLLVAKEAELEKLRREKRALLMAIIEAGPWALWEWIKKEIVEQGLEPGEDFEARWLAWLAVTERDSAWSVPSEGSASMSVRDAKGEGADFTAEHVHDRNSKQTKTTSKGFKDEGKSNLLSCVFSIVLQEGVANLQYVLEKGLFFVPLAWLWFWMSLSGRITWHVAGDISSRLRRCPFAFGFRLP